MANDGEDGANGGGGALDLLGGGAGGDGGGEQQQGGGDQGGGAGGDGGAGFVAPDWFDNVSAETKDGEGSSNRDWLQSKGVKDLDGLTKIARDTERALRENGRIKVPGEGAKPEEVTAFRAAIGVPDKIDGYEVKAPDGVQLNDALIGALRESALKHGAPKGAFEGLVTDFIQLQREEADAETKRQDDLAANWAKEQGGKKDEQIAHINTAARALDLSKTDMMGLRAGLGADRALGLLAKLGAGMAEDTMITGGKGRFGVTAAEAQVELDKMKTEPEMVKKIMIANSPEKARWDRLNRLAAEGKAQEQQRL